MESAIHVESLVKRFGDLTVLDGIDLDVVPGTVFGLLGPNGAGKTTTVHILSTLLRPDGGIARVAGHDVATEPRKVRKAIGVTGQFSAVDDLLTGEENLQMMADLRHLRGGGKRRVVELLEQFDLTDAARKPLATYSGGMRRKLDLAMTLVSRFRTIDISRSAVLSGHVLGGVIQQLFALVAVLGVALLMGFRSTASVRGWLGAAGFLAVVSYAMSWLGAAFGVFAKGVESASNLPAPLMILPFLGSGFVSTETMPGWMQWFAAYQPFTPFTETLRALLFGSPLGVSGWLSLVWLVVIGVGGWAWAALLYERKTVR